MKAGRTKGYVHPSLLNSALDGTECSTLRAGQCTPCARSPPTHGIGVLKVLERR
jgi:hypothetical protein